MAKRLAKEIKEFQEEPKDWCKATVVGDNLFQWNAEILAPVRKKRERKHRFENF